MKSRLSLLAVLPLIGLAFLAAAPGDDAANKATPAVAEVTVPFFGNAMCPMGNKPIKADKYAEKDGVRIYTCCGKCAKAIEADFDKYKDQAYPSDKVVDVKNANCPIGKGKAKDDVTFDWQGHRVHFCCSDCEAGFKEAPAKNLAIAMHPDLKIAGNAKCPIMGEDDADPNTFVIYKDVLVNLCCDECIEKFKKDPDAALKAAGVDLAKDSGKAEKADEKKQGG